MVFSLLLYRMAKTPAGSLPVDFEVSGRRFRYRKFGGLEGRKYAIKIINEIGPAIDHIVAKAESSSTKEQLVMIGVSAISSKLSPTLFCEIADAFASRCDVCLEGNKWPKVTEHYDWLFEDDYLDQIMWFKECFAAEFKSFLDGAIAKIKGALAKVEDPSA
jgi:hypothetical protein